VVDARSKEDFAAWLKQKAAEQKQAATPTAPAAAPAAPTAATEEKAPWPKS
jgi:heme/copper-type cytochrome/quinol oxidase subunit 2